MAKIISRVAEWVYVFALFAFPAGFAIWGQQWGLLAVYGFAGVGFIIVESYLHFVTGKTITKRMRLLMAEQPIKAWSVIIGLLAFAVMLSLHFAFHIPW